MRVRKAKAGKFEVESSKKGKFYTVDLKAPSCTCAHFLFRLRSTGEKCKHISAVEEKHGKNKKAPQKSILAYSRILDEVKKKGEMETILLMEKYSEQEVQELINNGELIEHEGKSRIVE